MSHSTSITLTNLSLNLSNHPPSIIKQLPFSIESRLSILSSSEKIFNESAPIYQDSLKKSGYDYKLKYQKNTSTATSRQQRKRKIIWCNPPYSVNISTNVGCYFLNLVCKHSPPHHTFSKIFNRNNIKIVSQTVLSQTGNQESTYIRRQ